jgi:hypothetical protein
MPTKSIPAVKVPATMPLQQQRRIQTSCRGRRVRRDAAATDLPAAAMPSLWQLALLASSLTFFVRYPFGRFFLSLSSLFNTLDSSIWFGRDVLRQNCGESAFQRRFNRLALHAVAVLPLQRSQQKIYRVVIPGLCRIATPEDVPA